jgi:hypothetical protein
MQPVLNGFLWAQRRLSFFPANVIVRLLIVRASFQPPTWDLAQKDKVYGQILLRPPDYGSFLERVVPRP